MLRRIRLFLIYYVAYSDLHLQGRGQFHLLGYLKLPRLVLGQTGTLQTISLYLLKIIVLVPTWALLVYLSREGGLVMLINCIPLELINHVTITRIP